MSGLSLLCPRPSRETSADLAHRQAARRGEQDVEQDLEALAGHVRRHRLEQRPAQHEIAAHRIGQLRAQHPAGQGDAGVGQSEPPPVRKPRSVASRGKAAGDHDVGAGLLQQRQHLRQPGLVVLQVAVDDGDDVGRGGHRPLDHRRGQAAAADAAQAAYARIGGGDGAQRVGGAVRAVIVHEHRFPGDAVQRRMQLGHKRRHVHPLVVAWHDHAQCRSAAHQAAGRRSRTAAEAQAASVAAKLRMPVQSASLATSGLCQANRCQAAKASA